MSKEGPSLEKSIESLKSVDILLGQWYRQPYFK